MSNLEKSNQIMPYLRAYFDLCSEEWRLNFIEKIITEKVWKNWEEGMHFVFKKKAFVDAWKTIAETDTGYYDEPFVDFVDKLIENNKNNY
jgi:hypothetical protein